MFIDKVLALTGFPLRGIFTAEAGRRGGFLYLYIEYFSFVSLEARSHLRLMVDNIQSA